MSQSLLPKIAADMLASKLGPKLALFDRASPPAQFTAFPGLAQNDQAKGRGVRGKRADMVILDDVAGAVTTALQPAKNSLPDAAKMADLLDKQIMDVMLDKKAALAYAYGGLMTDKSRLYPYQRAIFDRLKRRDYDVLERERPEFVKTALEAARAWGAEISMRLCIPPSEAAGYRPDFIRAWIWGPEGEFTGFARVQEMDAAERELMHTHGRVPKSVSFCTPGIPDVQFRFSRIPRRRTIKAKDHWDDVHVDLDFASYIQFDSYEDYVRWERHAARDSYREIATRGY